MAGQGECGVGNAYRVNRMSLEHISGTFRKISRFMVKDATIWRIVWIIMSVSAALERRRQ